MTARPLEDRARHRRPSSGALLRVAAAAVLASVGGCVAAMATGPEARTPVVWCAGAAGLMLVLAVVHGERRTSRAVRRYREYGGQLARTNRELESLRDEVLPLVRTLLDQTMSPQTIMARLEHRQVLSQDARVRDLTAAVVEFLWQERRNMNVALGVLRECAQRANAQATNQLHKLSELKQPYWNGSSEPVARGDVRDLLETTETGQANMGLLTQRLLILTGARRIGRSWPQPIDLERVVRAATGALGTDFRRVRRSLPQMPVKVESEAVNAVIHVLSEVLDNALTFSAPTTEVKVSAEVIASGVLLHIEDRGLGITPQMLSEVRLTLDPGSPLKADSLSGNRLGLAAARLAGGHFGITVEYARAHGAGTRASVFIPHGILTRRDVDRSHSVQAPHPRTSAEESSPPALHDGVLAPPAAHTESLPTSGDRRQLPRRSRWAAVPRSDELQDAPVPPVEVQPRAPEEHQRRLSAFRSATRPRTPQSPEEEPPPPPAPFTDPSETPR